MDKGRIVAQGDHLELLRSSEEYQQLIESQALELGGNY
jgi:ABC-type multidrug transport system fused ATPase/permease subunit